MRHRELIRGLNRTTGPLQRIGMSLMSLLSPGTVIVATFVGFTEAIKDMDDEQLEAVFSDE